MKAKTRRYESEDITVEYEPTRCIHAEACVQGLPAVFDAKARPWVQPSNAPADEIAEVVRRCPTGALRYRRTDGGAAEEPPAENTLRVIPDGPLVLAGRLRLELPDGRVLTETRVALCRCGASKNKPFCDNSHRKESFSDPGTAIEHRLRPESDPADGALKISLAPNGPLLVDGPLEVIPASGAAARGTKAAMCRCGASSAKPYCDGSHAAIGFTTD